MDNNLIFDVGMHRGEDTLYYLTKNFRVVGIDADPNLIESAKNYFSNYLMTNQLVLLNFAISNKDNEELDFHISQHTELSSLKKSLSDRGHNLYKETIRVKSKRLSSLMIEFGVPYYCKIDIEGYDLVCLETLSDLNELPRFLSVETECLDEFKAATDEKALATLNMLNRLGYRKFKLVDQSSLSVLRPDKVFYRDIGAFLRTIELARAILRKLKIVRTNRDRLCSKFKFTFPPGSTGPFGEELDHPWMDYDTAKRTLLFHRNSYMKLKLKEAVNYGFWCDWHAKLE